MHFFFVGGTAKNDESQRGGVTMSWQPDFHRFWKLAPDPVDPDPADRVALVRCHAIYASVTFKVSLKCVHCHVCIRCV
jgi:hypothetical protein